MAAVSTSYTVYKPGIPLDQQVVPLAPPKVEKIDMTPMIAGAPPLEIKTIEFKPLQIKKYLVNITLTSRTAVEMTQEGRCFYEKYTFTIKNQADGKVLYSEIPSEKIEDTVKKIYSSHGTNQNN